MNPFLQALLDKRAKIQERIDAVLDGAEQRVAQARAAAADGETVEAELTDEELRQLEEFSTELAPLDERIRELRVIEERAQAAAEAAGEIEQPAHVRSEPMVYGRGSGNSFFRDLVHAQPQADAPGAAAARERLQRHRQELDVEMRSPERRANMNRTDGTGGEFVPPLWLMDEYLPLARAGRVAAELCRSLPLPAGTDSINIPRVATGTAVAAQSDGASVQKTDMTTGSVSASVSTFAGQQVFAMQLLDQSPLDFDEVVFLDLLADHAVKFDTAVITAILAVSGLNAVTYTDASPTVPELYPKLADAALQVSVGRFLPAQAHLMHPRRWAWHVAALDGQNRPLVVPNAQGPSNAFAGMGDVRAEGAVGELQGLPVYTDPNVPVNLGGSTNEDRIVTARWDDVYLFEGPIRTRVLFETDADTLSVRLQLWNYAAILPHRYPKAISVVAGTGLATPTL